MLPLLAPLFTKTGSPDIWSKPVEGLEPCVCVMG
jgi:hypothetical protein